MTTGYADPIPPTPDELRAFRASRRWTQEDAAQWAGLSSAQSWAQMESGRKATRPWLRRLMDAQDRIDAAEGAAD